MHKIKYYKIMSKLRSINTVIWSDPWFEVLEPSAKLLFIYLVTNEKTNMLGVYEISVRKVSFETNISSLDIERYLKEFEVKGKIKYAENRVLLLNFLKHQNYNFNMMKSAIRTYNKLPLSLKIKNINNLEETKEGFETLCNGFAGVRKYEYKYELEDELEKEDEDEFKNFDTDSILDIDYLFKYYMQNDKLIKAFIGNKDNKINNKEHLELRLQEFIQGLKEVGRLSESFKEFSTYFRNWNKVVKQPEAIKSNPNNEEIISFTTNLDPTLQKLPKSEFLSYKERMTDGGYKFKIV
tara:strand:+ start:1 stop:885 length:885 start_codon:yes stop_codon:yes gene_type:complete